MQIDAHQHFWRYRAADFGWITPEKVRLKRAFLPADLRPLLAEQGFDGCIAVQARQNLEETEWLLALADEHPFIKGVVGWVDLRSPNLPTQLKRFSRHPKLVGVRHVVHDEPDDDFMLRRDFRAGLARLQAFDLAYDFLVFAKHLPVALQVAQEFPQQRFVLDHIGKPEIRRGVLAPWAEHVEALARLPNVSCKLSGMVTEAAWDRWDEAEYESYLDVVMKAFGPDRVMIGSDWPVCTLACSYGATIGVVKRYIERFSTAEQQRVLGGNCARIYGIETQEEHE